MPIPAFRWYNSLGRLGAKEISSAYLAVVEDGFLRRQRQAPAVSRCIARLRRDLQSTTRTLLKSPARLASAWS